MEALKMNNEEQLKNTINSILKQENWVEFTRTATCCYRNGRFYNLNDYNCYKWYNEIYEEAGYGISTKPLYDYINDKEASELLKQAYDKASKSEDWDEYTEKEIEILSNLNADKLEMATDWEVNHIYEINDIKYFNKEQSQVIIAEAHTSRCWGFRRSYLVYDITSEKIEETWYGNE